MRTRSIIILVIFSSLRMYGQDYTKGKIILDGSISYNEIIDTTYYKKVKQSPGILIKEGENSYYIGISSNDFLITNIYLKKKSGFQILHASGSLGSTFYFKDKNTWKSKDENYHWAFVDPFLREVTIDREALRKEQASFYHNFQWVGTTFAMGSTKESEFIISKALVFNIEDIVISFYFKNDQGNRINKLYPDNITKFSNSLELDKELMNGYLPELEKVYFKY